jgi:hypothetical protein
MRGLVRLMCKAPRNCRGALFLRRMSHVPNIFDGKYNRHDFEMPIIFPKK